MSEEQFWQIIEKTREASLGDLDKQYSLLVQALVVFGLNEIIEFYKIYINLEVEAYTFELCAAHFLLNGHNSDDTFNDFQGWLITRGKEIFYAALDNPEILAQVAEPRQVHFELFSAILDACYELTGEYDLPPLNDYKHPKFIFRGKDWQGWEEAATRYPKLVAKYLAKYGE